MTKKNKPAPNAAAKKPSKKSRAPVEQESVSPPPTDASVREAEDTVLGTLPGGSSSDSALSDVEPPAEPEHEQLRLPRGAFVGLRKSGGLKFSTREVVVYPDGRVAYDARGVPQKEYTRLRRALNDGQTMSLRKLLDQTNFWKTEGGGRQNPDAFAYEIAARLGQRSNEIEVFDGSIPESLRPLIELLTKLLPE